MMKAPITSAQAMLHPTVVETVNAIGAIADEVLAIRSAARQRDKLRKYIRDTLSNQALAKSYGVHERTIEKVLTRETASHIA